MTVRDRVGSIAGYAGRPRTSKGPPIRFQIRMVWRLFAQNAPSLLKRIRTTNPQADAFVVGQLLNYLLLALPENARDYVTYHWRFMLAEFPEEVPWADHVCLPSEENT